MLSRANSNYKKAERFRQMADFLMKVTRQKTWLILGIGLFKEHNRIAFGHGREFTTGNLWRLGVEGIIPKRLHQKLPSGPLEVKRES